MDEQELQKVVIRKSRSGFASREQKAGFVLLICTGGLALLLGGFYLVRQVKAPFDISYTGPAFVTSTEREAQELEKQKNTDTDRDGLTDYDELYVYRTSPYLADSDSDGYSDSTEIATDQDPNCPRGKECFDGFSSATSTSGTEGIVNSISESSADRTAQLQALQEAIKSLSATQIRQLLVDAGADQATVDKLSDEELIAVYQQVISQYEASGELNDLLESSVSNTTTP